MIIDTDYKPFYKKEQCRHEHKATIKETIEQEGKYGTEIVLVLEDLDGKLKKLSLWRTHLVDLARDYNEKDTSKWVGLPIFFKAVEIVKADGTEALGWHVRGVQAE